MVRASVAETSDQGTMTCRRSRPAVRRAVCPIGRLRSNSSTATSRRRACFRSGRHRTDVDHDEIKQLMATAEGGAVLWSYADDIEPILHRAAELVTMDDSERRSLILVNPGLAPRRATVSDDVHGLPAQRCRTRSCRRTALAQRDPLRPDGQRQFHRRRGREHRVRPGRHGADAERHLAQPRQQSATSRRSISRCSTCRWSRRSTPSISSTTTPKRRTASWCKKKQQSERFPPDYSQRVYGEGGLMPRFLVAQARRRRCSSPMYVYRWEHDARAARAASRTGTAIPTKR